MNNPFLIDTHCHLHFPAYDVDREAVLARMREKGIWGITIGTASQNSQSAVQLAEIAEAADLIWATVGLHPSHTTSEYLDENEGAVQEHEITKETLLKLARSSKKVVAIGETGLDFYRLDQVTDPEAAKIIQEKIFRTHLAAAHELDLPIVIHCREALTELTHILQTERSEGRKVRGVVHSFTGTWQEAEPLIELGMHLGINGITTFPLRKGQAPETAIDRIIENIPLENLLLETDAPYLAPVPFRGKRNEPAYVEEVAKHVARIRDLPLEQVAAQTSENARKLFGLER